MEFAPITIAAPRRPETRTAFNSASVSAMSCGAARSASRLRFASSSSIPDGSIAKIEAGIGEEQAARGAGGGEDEFGRGHDRLRLRRFEAEQPAVVAVGDEIEEPVGALTHVADIGKTVDEQPLFAEVALAVEFDAEQRVVRQRAGED